MPLALLIPLLVVGWFALWALLLRLGIVQRHRLGKARGRVQPWYVRWNAWLLAASTLLFVGFAAVMGRWIDGALPDGLAGLAIGTVVGLLGLALDRFESTSQGFFRTPNRWLVLALSLLVAGRLAIGLWLAWSDGPSAGTDTWITRGAWSASEASCSATHWRPRGGYAFGSPEPCGSDPAE